MLFLGLRVPMLGGWESPSSLVINGDALRATIQLQGHSCNCMGLELYHNSQSYRECTLHHAHGQLHPRRYRGPVLDCGEAFHLHPWTHDAQLQRRVLSLLGGPFRFLCTNLAVSNAPYSVGRPLLEGTHFVGKALQSTSAEKYHMVAHLADTAACFGSRFRVEWSLEL
jgi:hypothetical protein